MTKQPSDANVLVAEAHDDGQYATLKRTANQAGVLLQEHALPVLERMIDALTQPEHIERLQGVMGMVANQGFKLGFDNDPGAALLYEFAQDVEQRHGRDAVMAQFARFNSLTDGTLIDVLQMRFSLTGVTDEDFESKVRPVRMSLLHLLCALAYLDEDAPYAPAPHASPKQIVERFEQSLAPTEFHVLARAASGDAQALSDIKESHAKTKPKRGWLGRKTDNLKASMAKTLEEAEAQASTALVSATARIRANDPALGFLATSYLFFVQTYTTRALIESLPEMIAQAKAYGQQADQHDKTQAEVAANLEVIDL